MKTSNFYWMGGYRLIFLLFFIFYEKTTTTTYVRTFNKKKTTTEASRNLLLKGKSIIMTYLKVNEETLDTWTVDILKTISKNGENKNAVSTIIVNRKR